MSNFGELWLVFRRRWTAMRWPVLAIFFFLFLMRVLVSGFGIHYGDFGLWVSWGTSLWQGGFADFFATVDNDRLPGGILYLLWLLAGARDALPFLTNELVYKLPSNLADVLVGYLAYLAVSRRWDDWLGMAAGLMYAANPFTWYVTALWGQMDAVQSLLLVFVVMSLTARRFVVSSALITYAFLFKPHSIVIAPLLLVYLWVRRRSYSYFFRIAILMLLASLAVFWLSGFPFARPRMDSARPLSYVAEPVRLVWERYVVAYDRFPYASVNAFNVWGAADLDWKPDNALFAGLSYQVWGWLLFGLLSLIVLIHLFRRGTAASASDYYLAAALLVLLAFTFLTRAHERHLYPFFGLIVFGLFERRSFFRLYVAMTFVALVNSTSGVPVLWGWHTRQALVHGVVRGAFSLISVIVCLFLLQAVLSMAGMQRGRLAQRAQAAAVSGNKRRS